VYRICHPRRWEIPREGSRPAADGGQRGDETGILTTGRFAEWQHCGRVQDSVTGGVDQELRLELAC
jgi:hypothetical protein